MVLDKETGILRGQEFSSCDWLHEAPRAQLADLLRVHDYEYLQVACQLALGRVPREKSVADLEDAWFDPLARW